MQMNDTKWKEEEFNLSAIFRQEPLDCDLYNFLGVYQLSPHPK